MKTLDPHYLAPVQFGIFGGFCLCLGLRPISFSIGSSLLVELVLASIMKNRLISFSKWNAPGVDCEAWFSLVTQAQAQTQVQGQAALEDSVYSIIFIQVSSKFALSPTSSCPAHIFSS